jgi:hypothetical protein
VLWLDGDGGGHHALRHVVPSSGGRLTSLAVGHPWYWSSSASAIVDQPGRLSVLRTLPGADKHETMGVEHQVCDGTVIVHVNRAVTCSNPECDAASSGVGAVLNRHGRFVAGMNTLGPECPICHSPFR